MATPTSSTLNREKIEADLDAFIDEHLDAQQAFSEALGKVERQRAAAALDRTRERMHIARDAMHGDESAYLKLKAADAAIAASKNQSGAQREAPVAALSFDMIREVAELTRRLAIEDYWRHIAAVSEAPNEAEKVSAVAKLHDSERAARLADNAVQSIIAAEAAHRSTTANLVIGKEAEADVAAKASGEHLNMVADRLDRYGAEAPESKFFGAAFAAVAKADELAGHIGAGASRKAEGFTENMRAFAQRVKAFADTVSRTPEIVVGAAKAAGHTVAEMAVSVFGRLKSGVSSWLGSANAKVEEAAAKAAAIKDKAKSSAWDALDRAGEAVERAKSKASDVADVVREQVGLHADMAVIAGGKVASIGGGLLSAAGRAVADGYTDLKDEAQATRRNTRKP
ncbi:hypothetical protein [Paucibacter soli]|uniref:hypothetical protein n=1 Tax=Paucibacter soli TaxID=3133433 RepID=UPI003094D2FD